MQCSRCQRDNPPGNAFCHSCGGPLGGYESSAPRGASQECPRCGADNGPNVQYCRACGTDLARASGSAAASSSRPPRPQGAVCAACGSQGDPNARFCKYCGAPYSASQTPSVASAAQPAARTSTGQAQVVVILRDGSEGGVYPLSGDRTDVGGREGDIVLPDDPYMSPRHARIERRGDTFTLRDLGSVNGIYFRLREPVGLSDGDMILIGQQVLRFETLSEAERSLGAARQHGVMVFGTPESARLARVSQYTTEGVERDVYYLYRDETVFGREQADVVFAEDPFLSRRHAAISLDRDRGTFSLRDLGSSNGTAIRCRSERRLGDGDQFRVGRHLFRFDLGGSAGGRSLQ